MNLLHDITAGENVPEDVRAIIEIPKNSQNKYEYDKKLESFKLDRVLFSPFHYPGDYGFIPQTLAEDGDPADCLVLMNQPTYPGIIIDVRPIGVLPMIDNGDPDHKILCVPVNDVRFAEVKDISDVQKATLNEIAHFFQTYKQLEGKTVTTEAWQDAAAAKAIIIDAVKRYQDTK